MWLIDDLSLEDLLWKPPESDSRTITSYFRHIINAEIYWLQQLGIKNFEFIPESSSIGEMKKQYLELEVFLCERIDNLKENELKVVLPSYSADGKLEKMGSFTWMVIRTSHHAMHHFGQVSHIRYASGNPPNPKTRKFTWGQITDILALSSIP